MKFETKRAENYSSLFISFKVPFVSKTFRLHTTFYNTPETWVQGYSSRTAKSRYVLFHDFDKIDFASLVEELRYLQKRFKLSNYYVFKLDRENSFHAVCLDTFSLSEAYEIQKETSCDLAFVHAVKNLQTREWVLRIGKKGDRRFPKYFCAVESKNDLREKSSAHADFLKKFGVPKEVVRGDKWDGCKKLAFVRYDTANRVEREGLN